MAPISRSWSCSGARRRRAACEDMTYGTCAAGRQLYTLRCGIALCVLCGVSLSGSMTHRICVRDWHIWLSKRMLQAGTSTLSGVAVSMHAPPTMRPVCVVCYVCLTGHIQPSPVCLKHGATDGVDCTHTSTHHTRTHTQTHANPYLTVLRYMAAHTHAQQPHTCPCITVSHFWGTVWYFSLSRCCHGILLLH